MWFMCNLINTQAYILRRAFSVMYFLGGKRCFACSKLRWLSSIHVLVDIKGKKQRL